MATTPKDGDAAAAETEAAAKSKPAAKSTARKTTAKAASTAKKTTTTRKTAAPKTAPATPAEDDPNAITTAGTQAQENAAAGPRRTRKGDLQYENVFLREMWYFAMPSHGLRIGKMKHKTMLGEPVLLARKNDGSVFAIRDICPHRGIPLSYGSFDGEDVECPYHGWTFGEKGTCTCIPSLVDGQDFDITRIKTRGYPVRELQGNIWVWFGEQREDLPEPPRVPWNGAKYQFHLELEVDCNIDHAVIGLMDPAHGPYVHKSPLWRSKKTSYQKEKKFSPRPFGWAMDKHKASKNSKAYKIFLGGLPETEISFQLPSTRIEHAVTEKYNYAGLTCCTPIDEKKTSLHHTIYHDSPVLTPLNPILRQLAIWFLGQDATVITQQQYGLSFDPTLMLIKDADQMAMWYFRLKREWLESQADGREFVNPIEPVTLRWKS